MRAIVVGGDGFIGATLVRTLIEAGHQAYATTRRRERVFELCSFLDLSDENPEIPDLATFGIVYLVAAVGTFQGCEGSASAYRINVDAPCQIAHKAVAFGTFPVFVSSDCVEWCGSTAYARQKSLVEMVIHGLGGAIVRPSRVNANRVVDLCKLLLRVGETREPGVHRWA